MKRKPKLGEWVVVDWKDASHYAQPSTRRVVSLMNDQSAGRVVQIDREAIAIAQSVAVQDSGDELWNHVEVIPHSWILKIHFTAMGRKKPKGRSNAKR